MADLIEQSRCSQEFWKELINTDQYRMGVHLKTNQRCWPIKRVRENRTIAIYTPQQTRSGLWPHKVYVGVPMDNTNVDYLKKLGLPTNWPQHTGLWAVYFTYESECQLGFMGVVAERSSIEF